MALCRLAVLSLFAVASAATAEAAGSKPQWAYLGSKESQTDSSVLTPKDWALGYPSCGESSQSPINFKDSDSTKTASSKGVSVRQTPLQFEGDCSKFALRPGEHAFKWVAQEEHECQVYAFGDHKQSYSLSRFQIHSPSEHTINGRAYDAEIQFVHTLDGDEEAGAALVVSLFVERHRTKKKLVQSEWMNAVWESMRFVNETTSIDESYSDLLLQRMQMGDVFQYEGSETTPPCTEGVSWWVVRTPLYVSQVYLENFEDMLVELAGTDDGKNARSTQPRNGRLVTAYRDVVDQE